RRIKPPQVGDIDIGCYDMSIRADLLGQPDGHRSPAGADLEAAPAWPDQVTPPAGGGVGEMVPQGEAVILRLPPPPRGKPVARFDNRSFVTVRVCAVRHIRNRHISAAVSACSCLNT